MVHFIVFLSVSLRRCVVIIHIEITTLHVCFIILHYFDWLTPILHPFEIDIHYTMKFNIHNDTRTHNKASALHTKCTSINSFTPQWIYKKKHSILKWLETVFSKTKSILWNSIMFHGVCIKDRGYTYLFLMLLPL